MKILFPTFNSYISYGILAYQLKRIFLIALTTLSLFNYGYSQHTRHSLMSVIESLKSDTGLSHASWSTYVLNTRNDSVLAEYNSNISLTPASTLKILTTAAGISILGAGFRYETRLEYDGILDSINGILHGNLFIKGSGDPTLQSTAFSKKSDSTFILQKWAVAIAAKGIKKIEGGVIGDASIFEYDAISPNWLWGDIGNYYGAGASGLNFRDNKLTVTYKSGRKKGDTTSIIKITPHIKGLQLINLVQTGNHSDSSCIYGAPYDNLRVAKGEIPANRKSFEIAGSIPDPALLCAQSLDSCLRQEGVMITEKSTTTRLLSKKSELNNISKRIELYTHSSITLDSIINHTNIRSDNLYAEAILKTISSNKAKIGSADTGIEIVSDFWKSKGINLSKGFFMSDGCGLSRLNAITTKQLTEILYIISKDSILFKKFYPSLPIAGKSGSIAKVGKKTFAENNLHAKSGYMTRVRSYAGYVTTIKGDLLCFSIIVNNYDCTSQQMKDKMEKIMIAIAESE